VWGWGLSQMKGGLLGAAVVFLAAGTPAFADEPGRLVGQVMTKGTRDVVPLAQIRLADGGHPSAETDAEGRFQVSTSAAIGVWGGSAWLAPSPRPSPRSAGRGGTGRVTRTWAGSP